MITAAILFLIAALGGATMAAIRLRGNPLPPLWLAALHGVIAAAGLIILILIVFKTAAPTIVSVALAGFIIGALGGILLLFGFHLEKRELPIPIMLTHGTIAVISFVILLIAIFGAW